MPTSRQSGLLGICTRGGPTKKGVKLRRSLTREPPPVAGDRSAFARLRSVAPERRSRARGRLPRTAFTAEERDVALDALRRDMFAKTTWKSIASMHRTIDRLLSAFNLTLLPFRTETVFALGAALKACKYRSAKNYLSAAALKAERLGTCMTSNLRRALADTTRSCVRGIGPAKR